MMSVYKSQKGRLLGVKVSLKQQAGAATGLKRHPESFIGPASLDPRWPSSNLLPFLVWGPLIKTEESEKRYPYYEGVTGEPRTSP